MRLRRAGFVLPFLLPLLIFIGAVALATAYEATTYVRAGGSPERGLEDAERAWRAALDDLRELSP